MRKFANFNVRVQKTNENIGLIMKKYEHVEMIVFFTEMDQQMLLKTEDAEHQVANSKNGS